MRNIFRFHLAAFFFSVLLLQSPSFAFQTDNVNHVIAISPSTSASQNTNEIRNAVNVLVNRSDKATHWTMKLAPGKYLLSAQISLQGLQNTSLTSADLTQPAKLVKMPGWNSASSAEYLLSFRLCKNVELIGMEFYGQTSFANDSNPNWPDQGVYFGSCDTVKVDQNKFFNIGNSALRVSTWEHDPVVGVHSFNTTVTNNTFNNIYQTSTTVQDNIHGGTSHYRMENNNFVNLRGSVKFASRTAGAEDVHVINNVINGGDHFGLEINNYNNFEIRGNIISNIKSVAVNIYTAAGIPGFSWGNNFTISGNTLKNVDRSIRYSHEPAANGFQNVPTNLAIESNALSFVTNPNSFVAAIMVENGKVNGLSILSNKLNSISSKKYISVTQGSTLLSILNNTVNGTAFGPQTSTASN
jgi:hypothetical protein